MSDTAFRTLRVLHLHLLENAQMDAAHASVQRQVSSLESERALLATDREELQREQMQLRCDEAALAAVEAQLKAEKALLDLDRQWLREKTASCRCCWGRRREEEGGEGTMEGDRREGAREEEMKSAGNW